ncbi:MAG: hypothetical protein A2622_11420 [Bdellovibrionales bacterium RIFCSPHIGHO2_01_FULL_40_29]|nr:MAG: hypothetical protein A2622_11420 [Bdellovibrionales bacterium RIFCSPHIGHO2_01_FULL_40_29]OFZ34558.1 MAG: hypothetical protein A3D17_01685 [Bdellovibrionales bacterium RIFCSPHIGHO2_02_FULL_40_15]
MKFMRDVTPDQNSIDLKALIHDLIEFIKNPVQRIRILPDWNWSSLFIVQILVAIASGILASIIKMDFGFWFIARTIIAMPIVTTLMALLLTFFVYYYFQFFENRSESFRKILILIILSSIPFYIFQIASAYFAPISLIGFGFTAILAVIGLCENFGVEKKRAYTVVGVLFAIVLVTWISNRSF